VKVYVNDAPRELADGTTIAALVATLDLAGRRIAVELNQDIVPKSLHAQTILRDQDRIEIVHAIGGG
jgi:sulfur carrier protein